jgi:hypothetical protein
MSAGSRRGSNERSSDDASPGGSEFVGSPFAVVFSPIHTHDTSGIVHIESPTVRPFTLGQFFDVWGVRFTSDCIGGDCNSRGCATPRLRER